MAKLKDVKVVAECIEVGGERYEKSEDLADTGDVIRFTGRSYYLTEGGFYRVEGVDSLGDPYIIDDEDDEYDLVGEDFEVFKRAGKAQDSPTKLPDDYVIHDGQVYRKESRAAKVGEKVIVEYARHGCFIVGEVLTVEKVFDLEGGRCGVGKKYVLRPEDSSVLVPTDTVTIGGVEYAIEKRRPARDQAEKVLVVNAQSSGGRYDNGTIAVAEKLDMYGDPFINGRVKVASEYVVLEPKSETLYREVKRQACEGDRIRIVARDSDNDPYENGAEFEVYATFVNGAAYGVFNGKKVYVLCKEYVVLEPVPAEPARLRVGEYAKVEDRRAGFPVGTVVKVVEDDGSSIPFRIQSLDGTERTWAMECRLVRATDEEVAAAKLSQFGEGDKVRLVSGGEVPPLLGFVDGGVYEVFKRTTSKVVIGEGSNRGYARPDQIVKLSAAEVEELRPKIGDYVKVLRNSNDHNYTIGNVVRVATAVERGLSGKPVFFADRPDGTRGNFLRVEDVEKATEADWTAQQEAAKWSKIGRKVGELREGDLVRVIGHGEGRLSIGHVDTVTRVDSDGDVYFNTTNVYGVNPTFYLKNNVELVVPVEQRFDRAE